MNEPSAIVQAPADAERMRLLLDPYLCFAPGCEHHAPTLAAIARDSASLGLDLCVEQKSWDEATTDPDVLRRRVALWRFEPLVKIPDLPMPSRRDLAAHFVPARTEFDRADLRMLGALHARLVELLIADDGRLHRLASGAGLGHRVLTPSDALAWLEALAGQRREITVVEIEPRAAAANPALEAMLAADCEPFDPYLSNRLEAVGTRVLLANDHGRPVALGVLTGDDGEIALAAIAVTDSSRGRRAVEPVVAAALTIARRQRKALQAFVPPHEDHVLLLLGDLGFERKGRDRHGREIFRHALADIAARPAPGRDAWLVPLDAASHDRLVPELAGLAQAELFSAAPVPHTLGSPVRKQLLGTRAAREPVAGDLLLLFHARAPDRIRATSVTAAARVIRVSHAETPGELLTLCAGRQGDSLARLGELLAAGPVSVMDLRWLGRLSRPLSLSALIERELVASTPSSAVRLDAQALQRLAPELALG
ncbi:MAG: hypothetical protein WD793_06730 [Steroidobacteraceae bacterium]